MSFKDSKSFNSQNVGHKIYKYFKFLYLFGFYFSFRQKKPSVIHTIDLFATFIAILFKKKNTTLIYLQYELFEVKKLNPIDKLLFKYIQKNSAEIDLIITPEKNRTEYLKNMLFNSSITTFLTLPNSNNNQIEIDGKASLNSKNKTIVSHIGAVGLNHHIKSYLDAIMQLNKDKFEFRFIGLLTNEVIGLIESYQAENIKIIGQIKHSELNRYYLETDIGVILYKDVSLNHRFCAPNKLYEYWSYGIRVIGDKLPGLESVFTDKCLGVTIDMSEPSEIISAIEDVKHGNEDKRITRNYFNNYLKLNHYLNQLASKLSKNTSGK
ncbi:MAG: hypothetical protein RIC95_08725 [Vicingaceae bacterium]